MGVNHDGLISLQKELEQLQTDIPDIMDKIVVGEGMYARDQARKICTEDHIVNTGNYRRNFKSGTKAIRVGMNYKIDVFNNLDYAGHLEYGFRGHWVPGYWDGNSFVYVKGYKDGGMYVPFTPGHYTLDRAIKLTKRSQDARVDRKFMAELKRRGLDKYL